MVNFRPLIFTMLLIIVTSTQILYARPIIVGLPNIFPFSNTNTPDSKGIFNEIIEQTFKDTNLDYEIVTLPMARVIRGIENGSIDISLGFSKQGAEKIIDFGCHSNILVSNKNHSISSVEDLKDKQIGYIIEGIYARIYGSKFQTNNVYLRSDDLMFNMLTSNRLDGFFISNIVMDAYIKFGILDRNLPQRWHEQLAEPLVISSSQVNFHKSNNSTLPEKTITQIKTLTQKQIDKGNYTKIYQKYGVKNGPECKN